VKKGISLIELMVVIAIFAIVLLISMSITSNIINRSKFTGAVNNLISDISGMKQLAAKENRWVKITFSSDGTNYEITKQKKITDLTTWDFVKKVSPYEGKIFFTPGANDVTNFAINSRGEIKKVADLSNSSSSPSTITLKISIRKNPGGLSQPVIYQRIIKIFPYGGVKVEK
jgi:prepilin-type N-terminal cleavage/methylation domain-containing protein